jgi:phage terminase small subunit
VARKHKGLSHQERQFAEARVNGALPSHAARAAGYKSPRSITQLEQRPLVIAEIARLQQDRLFNEVLPLAVQVHLDLLLNPHVPPGAKVAAVKLAYDRTMGTLGPDGREKPPHEMTAEELIARIEALKDIKVSRAKPVEIEAEAEPVSDDIGLF